MKFKRWSKWKAPGRASKHRPQPHPLKILLADAQEIFRRGVRQILTEHLTDLRIFETDKLASVPRMVDEHTPHLIIIEPAGSDHADAAPILETLRRHPGDHRILVCTANHPGRVLGIAQVRLYADALIPRDCPSSRFLETVRRILDGERLSSPKRTQHLNHWIETDDDHPDPEAGWEELTSREREILLRITQGFTDREIGDSLYISPRTVHNHRINIMRKLDIHKAASLASFAVSHGISNEQSWMTPS